LFLSLYIWGRYFKMEWKESRALILDFTKQINQPLEGISRIDWCLNHWSTKESDTSRLCSWMRQKFLRVSIKTVMLFQSVLINGCYQHVFTINKSVPFETGQINLQLNWESLLLMAILYIDTYTHGANTIQTTTWDQICLNSS
jgi:hypothetical protein